ncbi:hypothetical protein DSO57_1031349 [Entomophthora muscae]|uniref:Uncharacterized protein n=1 Tax=Entomophthora muscae TaxID=34485 RepID=A0ACC2RFH5_9FUNG|nr:hypothetical protein DSO57_1031349 [Entomophthora muscae]
MDFLSETINAEIAKKKRQLELAEQKLGGKKKYIRKGDLEKIREEEYLAEQRRIEEEREEKLRAKLALEDIEQKKENKNQEKKDTTDETEQIGTIPEEEVIRRLRAKGQPIRLFDESSRQRQLRLRALELMEERSDGQRNDFMKVLEAMDTDLQLDLLRKPADGQAETQADKNKSKKGSSYAEIDTTELTMEMVQNNAERVFGLIYVFFKRALREWESDLDIRSEDVKRSQQGKTNAAIQIQAADYMRPFFRQLKKKTLDSDVLALIAEICIRLQEREYLKANDAYLRLSIGNAPWPIGVTMVGIHERSGREKIHSAQIAHVLNDETQRKWIQSIKRLMTFLQNKYPPSDLSKCVG